MLQAGWKFHVLQGARPAEQVGRSDRRKAAKTSTQRNGVNRETWIVEFSWFEQFRSWLRALPGHMKYKILCLLRSSVLRFLPLFPSQLPVQLQLLLFQPQERDIVFAALGVEQRQLDFAFALCQP